MNEFVVYPSAKVSKQQKKPIKKAQQPEVKKEQCKVSSFIKIILAVIAIAAVATVVVILLTASSETAADCDELQQNTPLDRLQILNCLHSHCEFDASRCDLPCPFGYASGSDGCPNGCTCAASSRSYQGDISFDEEDLPKFMEIYGILQEENEEFSVYTSAYISHNSDLWNTQPNNGRFKIAYEISDKSYTNRFHEEFQKAIKRFHRETCLDFVPRTTEAKNNYMDINQQDYDPGGECSAQVARNTKGANIVTLVEEVCAFTSVISHEIIHRLGFQHEQNRLDRNEFVELDLSKTDATQYSIVFADNAVDLGTDYDYDSVMHYEGRAHGNPNFVWMRRRDTGEPIYKTDRDLTSLDFLDVNRLYSCESASGAFWGGWGQWGGCRSCREGNRIRKRTCLRGDVPTCRQLYSNRESEEKSCTNIKCISTWCGWGQWTECDCTSGLQERTRQCDMLNGNTCEKSIELETSACTEYFCPFTDGPTTQWSLWSACTRSWGGSQTRVRKCRESEKYTCSPVDYKACSKYNPKIYVEGIVSKSGQCYSETDSASTPPTNSILTAGTSSPIATQPSFTNPPSAFSEWTNWYWWARCTKTCNGGEKTRTRYCQGPVCEGEDKEKKTCNEQPCPGQKPTTRAPVTTRRTTRTTTSRTTSRATTRTTTRRTTTTTARTTTVSIWGWWRQWGQCSLTCGGGTRRRTRICRGSSCTGKSVELSSCNEQGCLIGGGGNQNQRVVAPDPIRGGASPSRAPHWAEWTQWGSCSKTCGPGAASRLRDCIGGVVCDNGRSRDEQSKPCSIKACPGLRPASGISGGRPSGSSGSRPGVPSGGQPGIAIGGRPGTNTGSSGVKTGPSWGPWGPLSQCSATCGGGYKTRTRNCNGYQCSGSPKQDYTCYQQRCGSRQQPNVQPGGNSEVGAVVPAPTSKVSWTQWSSWMGCNGCPKAGFGTRRRGCNGGSTWHCVNQFKDRTVGLDGHISYLKCSELDSCLATVSKWLPWKSWQQCSKSCGGGWQLRFRTCSTVNQCSGLSLTSQSCATQACQGATGWTNWVERFGCNNQCGIPSVRVLYRTCIAPLCPGSAYELRKCEIYPCPVNLQAQDNEIEVISSFLFNPTPITISVLCKDSDRTGWVFGDFNGDERVDVLCGGSSGLFEVGLTDESGGIPAVHWQGRISGCGGGKGISADFNGDGSDDLLCQNKYESLLVINPSTNGEFTSPAIYQGNFCTGEQDYVHVIDANGDGRTDVLCFHRSTSQYKVMLISAT